MRRKEADARYQRMCVRAYERFNVCALVFLHAQDAQEEEELK